MKIYNLILAISFLVTSTVCSQKLSELYKKDVITLQPVTEFEKNTEPDKILLGYKQIYNSTPNVIMRKIVVGPDGSLFVSHKDLKEIWKFDKNGNFVKKFGSRGSKPGQFVMNPSVEGILDEKYVFTTDVQGRMNFYDLDGNYVKSTTLKYMPLGMVPLKGGKIAIQGHVPWKGEQSKQIVVIKDINTGVEQEIWHEFEPYEKNTGVVLKIPKNPTKPEFTGGMISFSLPFTHSMSTRFRMAATKNGNLIIASPLTGKVMEYTPEGKNINTFTLDIEPLKITDQDIQKIYDQSLNRADDFEKNYVNKIKYLSAEQKAEIIKSYRTQLIKFKDRSLYPEHLPYFSSVILDSDGNLLVFEFTNEEISNNNKFRVYSYDMKGKLLGVSSFKNESANLTFRPSSFQFFNGAIYALGKQKQNENAPIQIMKFKPVL